MRGTPAWLWPNLLSVDAPIVSLVWQDLAARAFGHPLGPFSRAVLALTVWAVYLADRLLDTRGAGPTPNTSRHTFYRRYRRALIALLAAVLATDTVTAILELRRAVFLHGVAVAAAVAVYLSIFPLRPSGWEKQALAAALFSTGVLLVSTTWVPLFRLLLPGALFAGLCLCNLVLMELWERGWQSRLFGLVPAAVAVMAAAHAAGAWDTAIALSGAMLTGIAISGRWLPLDPKRVLADAALLTPLLFR